MLTSQFWKVFYAYTRHKAVKMILVSRVEDIRKPASTEGEKHISKWFQKVTLNFKEILNFFEGPQAPRDVPDLKPTLEGIMLFSRDLVKTIINIMSVYYLIFFKMAICVFGYSDPNTAIHQLQRLLCACYIL